MFRVRLICTVVCWVTLVPLVFIADLPDWPLGVVYALVLAMIVFMLLLDERLTERQKRKRAAKLGPTRTS